MLAGGLWYFREPKTMGFWLSIPCAEALPGDAYFSAWRRRPVDSPGYPAPCRQDKRIEAGIHMKAQQGFLKKKKNHGDSRSSTEENRIGNKKLRVPPFPPW
jgi:hypothetical protein